MFISRDFRPPLRWPERAFPLCDRCPNSDSLTGLQADAQDLQDAPDDLVLLLKVPALFMFEWLRGLSRANFPLDIAKSFLSML
jgi:hypothetical protein